MQLPVAVVPGCRQPRLLALLALLSSLFLLALGTLWLSRTTYAAPVSPTAPGSIAGAVTNQAGAGLADIDVHLLRDGETYPTRRTTTDANGNYRFAVLAPGVYRVEFVDPAEIYAFQFYPAATTLADATLLFIAGDNRTGIDTVLPMGGVITGIITGTDGVQLGGIQRRLHRLLAPGEWQQWQLSEFTTTATFRYGGLATGNYQLCALSNAPGAGAFAECYDDGDDNTATPIAVTAGITTPNIDILLGNHVLYTQVKGRVTDEAGQPLAQIAIQSYAAEQPVEPLGSAESSTQGEYRLNFMQGGHYILRIVDPAGVYAPEYYNNVQTRAAATIFYLRDDSFVDGINISLTLAAHITGTVLIANQAPPDVGSVIALQQVNSVWQLAAQAPIDPKTGGYDLAGLTTGTYYLIARGRLGGDAFQSATDEADGRPVTVTTGERKAQVNFSLGDNAYEGFIAGTVSIAGQPAAGMRVELYRRLEYPVFQHVPIYYVSSDSNGRYRFESLLTGRYFLRFADPTGTYAATYYPDQLTPGAATTLAVSNTVGHLEVSTTLLPAGFIRGRITRYDGQPVAGALITPYLGAIRFAAHLHQTTSDAQGNYRITGLAAGNYYVQVAESGVYFGPDGSVFEPAKFYGGTSDPNSAVAVPVQAGNTTANINMILGPEAVVQLPLIQR